MYRALVLSLSLSALASAAQAQTNPVPLTSGRAVEGYLTPESPRFGGYDAPYECFVIETLPGETWQIDLTSYEYAPDLLVGRGQTCEEVWDQMLGDTGETGFPRINFTANTGGPYLIAASASRLDAKGPFTVTATRMPAP